MHKQLHCKKHYIIGINAIRVGWNAEFLLWRIHKKTLKKATEIKSSEEWVVWNVF